MAAALIAVTIAPEISGSRHRTSSASTTSRSAGSGWRPAGTWTSPSWTVWLSTSQPSSASSALASAPAATRAAVSLAEARSSTSRASSKPYFCMPTRSAWPGRGVERTDEGRPGCGDISSVHFGHSVFLISIATGEPNVLPWRMPPRRAISSTSKRIRGPRPKPRRRRANWAWTAASVIGSPAGSPSTMTTRAWPCDSPAVRNLSTPTSLRNRCRTPENSPAQLA